MPHRNSLPFSTVLLPFLAILALSVADVRSQGRVSTASRQLYQAHQDSLVVVTAQVRVRFDTSKGSLPDQQQTAQTLGTIIDQRGLVVLSNSAIDVSLGMEGQRGRAAGEDEFVEVIDATSVFEAIQINLADGTVYHAALLDRKEELDLAFLLLDQEELQSRSEPLPFLDVSRSTEGVSIGEQVIGLARSSSVYAYIPTVVPMFISAISKRDPTHYVTTVGAAQGMPVFNLGGRFVGLTVQRVVGGQRTGILGVLEANALNQRIKLVKAKSKALR